MSKATLTLITVSTCVLAVVYGSHTSCPLSVKVTLHVPEHFVADGKPTSTLFYCCSAFLNLITLLRVNENRTSYWKPTKGTKSEWGTEEKSERTLCRIAPRARLRRSFGFVGFTV